MTGCTGCWRGSAATRPVTAACPSRHARRPPGSCAVTGPHSWWSGSTPCSRSPRVCSSRSWLTPPETGRFIRFTDWRELPGALFLYLVLAPVIWTLYLWQPRLIVEVFDGLAQGGVVGPARYEGVPADAVLARLGGSLPRVRKFGPLRLSRGALLALLALTASVATLVIWPPTALPPFDRLLPESDIFWWHVVPVYFWAIWLPLVFINVYMLVWIVLRQTIMIANIQRLLRVFAVEPVPFHPDRCSGFAPIGSYATNIVRVALIVGSWALVLLLSGPLTGHGLYVAPHILFLVAVQVLLTPYLLLGPVWYAHRVMREAETGRWPASQPRSAPVC